MNRRLTPFLTFVVGAGLGAALLFGGGCSSSSSSPGGPAGDTGPAGDGSTCTTQCPSTKADPNNPPECGPDCKIPVCKSTKEVSSCPTDNGCMAVTKQSGDVLSMRMGRIRLWAPEALLSLAALAVDPNVNPKCFNNGNESFNWLIQVDKKNNTVKTGGARVSADHKTFAFLNETVDASALDKICPGFKGPTTKIDLSPITLPVHFTGNTFSSDPIKAVNIPIFDASDAPPIVLNIQEGIVKNVNVSTDGNCIGGWDSKFWCDGDSNGWTTGGTLVGKITAEDDDHVPVKTAGCQSLCAILANDSTKTDKGVCKRGADGKIIAGVGDTALADGTPAFLLSSTFAAYGVTISP